MLDIFNKMFTEYIKLAPEYWAIILIGVVVLTFLIALITGLAAGRFITIKSLMTKMVAVPGSVVKLMKKMPLTIKKKYKRARLANQDPSTYVTERDCVTEPFGNSLISRLWLVTFVATVICTLLAFFIVPLALTAVAEPTDGASYSVYAIPACVAIVGAVLTLIGGIVGKAVYGSALKVYAKLVPVMDGDAKNADRQQPQMQQPDNAAYGMTAEPVMFGEMPPQDAPVQAQQSQFEESHPIFTEQQPVYDPRQDYFEPVQEAPVIVEPPQAARPTPEELKRKEREEQAAARKAAAQQYAAEQAAARKAASEHAARARAASRAEAVSSGSADDVIARIEQIDREGAPRETMREVAALLQKERAKPENKNPEQQKKLNDALSKLLKAMSAASRK